MTDLAKAFDKTMSDIYRRADTKIGYRPPAFLAPPPPPQRSQKLLQLR